MKNIIILFDYGGVIAYDHQDPAEEKLMKIFNVDRKKISSLLSEKSEHGAAFREGKISEKEFWETVYTLSNSKGKCYYNYSELSILFAKTYKYNIELLSLVQLLRKQCKVGVLTNIDSSRSSYLVNKLHVNDYFDLYYPSFQYNSNKRKADLWMLINKLINNEYPNANIVYFDDRSEHVLSANKIGWMGIKYINIEDFKMKINNLINLNGVIL